MECLFMLTLVSNEFMVQYRANHCENHQEAEPFLKGVVIPLQDNVSLDLSKISSQVLELKESLKSLNSLEIKLKAAKEALLQTQTTNSLLWAEKEPSLDCDKAFIPSLAERVSFAAFQPVSGK
ncbi:hypothetical protein LguiA_018026 [Lonicera macranthoides]